MAPKKATIEKELAETVRRVYNSAQRDELTVNYVRQEVEKKLNLDEGFFKEGDWKAKSKEIIHETLVCSPRQMNLLDVSPMIAHS